MSQDDNTLYKNRIKSLYSQDSVSCSKQSCHLVMFILFIMHEAYQPCRELWQMLESNQSLCRYLVECVLYFCRLYTKVCIVLYFYLLCQLWKLVRSRKISATSVENKYTPVCTYKKIFHTSMQHNCNIPVYTQHLPFSCEIKNDIKNVYKKIVYLKNYLSELFKQDTIMAFFSIEPISCVSTNLQSLLYQQQKDATTSNFYVSKTRYNNYMISSKWA